MKNILILLAAFFLLTACVPFLDVAQMTPAQIGAKTTVYRDDFKKNTSIVAMPLVFGDYGIDNYNLAVFKSDSSAIVLYSLEFKTLRGYSQGWAFWDAAVDQDGKEFEVGTPSRDVLDGGSVRERISVNLTRAYLDSKRATGVTIRIDGKGVEQVINVPGNYIAAFLDQADTILKSNDYSQAVHL